MRFGRKTTCASCQVARRCTTTLAPATGWPLLETRPESTQPSRAQAVANAYATSYIDYRRKQAVDDVLREARLLRAHGRAASAAWRDQPLLGDRGRHRSSREETEEWRKNVGEVRAQGTARVRPATVGWTPILTLCGACQARS